MKETCNLLIENARKFLDPASLFQVCIMKGFLSMQRLGLGAINTYVDKMKGEGGQKTSVFVHAQGKKLSTRWGGGLRVC